MQETKHKIIKNCRRLIYRCNMQFSELQCSHDLWVIRIDLLFTGKNLSAIGFSFSDDDEKHIVDIDTGLTRIKRDSMYDL